MTKIITATLDRRYDISPNKKVTIAFEALADLYRNRESNADFGIIDSFDLSDICLSNQSFFESELENVFQTKGIENITIRGLLGADYESIRQRIEKETGERVWREELALDPRNPVLYKFERRNH